MPANFDVIVLGLGAAGSSALYHLSQSDKNVLGIDQFEPPHTLGSSHGQSRIIRQAYHESPFYVPFVKRAYALWSELEDKSGKKLFQQTGGIMLGSATAEIIIGSQLSAKTHGIPYEYLDNKAINQRFPALKATAGTVGVLENNAGILFPEECIKANLELAAKNQATIQLNEKVISIDHSAELVSVVTNKGQYTTSKLIITAGAWLGSLLPDLHLPLTVERRVLFWFKSGTPKQDNLNPEDLPIYIWEYAPGKLFYGFPDLGDGIKVAQNDPGLPTSPDILTKDVSDEEVQNMAALVSQYFNIDPVFTDATTCMYTNTPDGDFIIDHHPHNKNIIVASPCSGHGFKFASITGKILSDMAQDKKPELDITMFSLARFKNGM